MPVSRLIEATNFGAELTVRFPRDWLGDWRTVAGNVDRLVARLQPGR